MFDHVTMDRPGMKSQEYSPDMSKANATPMFKLAAADNRKRNVVAYTLSNMTAIFYLFSKILINYKKLNYMEWLPHVCNYRNKTPIGHAAVRKV